jgi:hypothetical protein
MKRWPIAALALACATFASTASSAPVDVEAGLAVNTPVPSSYRNDVEALGYDVGLTRLAGEAEGRAAFFVHSDFGLGDDALSIGPVLRAHWAHLYSPYPGVASIDAWAGFAGVREQLFFLSYPRLFFWADETLGAGIVGADRGHGTSFAWGVRGGIGVELGSPSHGARLTFGYALSQSTQPVTNLTGTYDWGGFIFGLEGYFRARER